MTKRIAIEFASAVQGPLYAVEFEDEVGYCYDWSFYANGRDGKRYRLRGHRVEGAVRNEEGFLCANRQARSQAERLVEKIEARGSIDPALWDVVPEYTAPEQQTYEEEKADALLWEATGRPAYSSIRR